MARNDRYGVELDEAMWQSVRRALECAREMARTTIDALRSVQQHTPSRVLSLLGIYFRLSSPPDGQDIMNIRDAYVIILGQLRSLRRRSFRKVQDRVARQIENAGGGDTFGYVLHEEDWENTIFLNETYFDQPWQETIQTRPDPNPYSQPRSHAARRTLDAEIDDIPTRSDTEQSEGLLGPSQVRSHADRGLVQGDPAGLRMGLSLENQAGVILHEATHLSPLSFGTEGNVHTALRHRPNVIGLRPDCNVSLPQITTPRAALMDAYVFQHFAVCVYRARRM